MNADHGIYATMAEEPPECQRYREISRTTLASIRQLEDQELERRFDELMTVGRPHNCPQIFDWQLSPADYSDELNRRAQNHQATMTMWISIVAIVIALMTPLWPLLGQAVEWLKELMAAP